MHTPLSLGAGLTVYRYGCVHVPASTVFTWMVIVNPSLFPPELLALIVYLAKARTREGKKERGEKRVCARACVCVCVSD